MVQRYVRVKCTETNNIYYGRLNLNHSVEVYNAPPWLGGDAIGLELAADTYQLLVPSVPSKIVAIGKNYANHAAEMGGEVPKEPLIFLKPTTTLLAHGESIHYPKISQKLEYEGELALIIGEICKDCNIPQAQQKIWGYTIANDVTARDLQRLDGQWTRAKSFDTFCPLGPWIVKEIDSEAILHTFLNDETEPRQSAPISEMSFSPAKIVSFISQIMTLFPGDIILTGTPQGVGEMKSGDRVRVEIEGIGALQNRIVSGLDWMAASSESDYRLPEKL
jgi:2-keto-4-pentenoate hydratase/2-oxohepta-3-ene-1,7-dioic acid hydratase in catechol pathway